MSKTWQHEYPAAIVAQLLCFKIAADGITSRNGGGVLFTDPSKHVERRKSQVRHLVFCAHAASTLRKQKHRKGCQKLHGSEMIAAESLLKTLSAGNLQCLLQMLLYRPCAFSVKDQCGFSSKN
jgi:hypothetical protein